MSRKTALAENHQIFREPDERLGVSSLLQKTRISWAAFLGMIALISCGASFAAGLSRPPVPPPPAGVHRFRPNEAGFSFPSCQRDQEAIENVSGIIVAGGKQGFAYQFQEPGPGQWRQPFPLDGRQGRIIAAGKADDLELTLSGLDRGPIVVARGEFDVTTGQFFDDFVQLSRREGDATGFRTVAL